MRLICEPSFVSGRRKKRRRGVLPNYVIKSANYFFFFGLRLFRLCHHSASLRAFASVSVSRRTNFRLELKNARARADNLKAIILKITSLEWKLNRREQSEPGSGLEFPQGSGRTPRKIPKEERGSAFLQHHHGLSTVRELQHV